MTNYKKNLKKQRAKQLISNFFSIRNIEITTDINYPDAFITDKYDLYLNTKWLRLFTDRAICYEIDRQILGEIICGLSKSEMINYKCNEEPDCKPFLLSERITDEIYSEFYNEI